MSNDNRINPKRFLLRKLNKKNFDDFLFLITKLAEYEKLVPPDASAIRRLRRDAFSKKARFEAYVGYLGKTPVAYLIFLFTYSSFKAKPTLFIEDIFVLEEYRRLGLGQKIFNVCVRKAKASRCGRVEFIVLDWNTSAQKFYEKNGAIHTNWLFYRREM